MKNRTKEEPLSLKRKQILSAIRTGDYAHAGEEEAIQIAMSHVSKNKSQLLLDVGCGLGGTADYLEKQGWGKVVGIDKDPEMVDHVKARYPNIEVHCCDALELAPLLKGKGFDVIYCLNAFFCFSDQKKVLSALSAIASEKAQLVLFDYAAQDHYTGKNPFADPDSKLEKLFHPINLKTIESSLFGAGWQLMKTVDLAENYKTWYEWLVARMDLQKDELSLRFGAETFENLHNGFRFLLDLLKKGTLGGVVIVAGKRPRSSLQRAN